jgi:hypothetical protein
MKNVEVTKKNGERERFDESKVRRSLMHSGADDIMIGNILAKLDKILHNGIETQKIFRFVFKELRKQELSLSTRYNLKQGIIEMNLGGGFIFEKFMARVFNKMGYKTNLNKIIRGEHIDHEIDIIATKSNEKAMVECKHFSRPFLGISIQTALYVYARFLDLRKSFNKVFLVTNTKFSPQVIDYSEGVGVKLIGWKYPKENGLEELIERYKIYPITMLPLSKAKIRQYLEKEVLTFEEILKEDDLSSKVREAIQKLIKKN